MKELIGLTLKNYTVIKNVGKGGFGEVYLAHQTNIEREVIIKKILPQHANQPDFIRRFEQEANLVARLEHFHIVPLYDFWRDQDGAYLVMRYMRGGCLKELLEQSPLSLESCALLVDQVSSALSFAHQHQVIHRDIKPGNLLMDDDGNAFLADFGIAKDLQKLGDNETSKDAVVGTLDYLSPEQARGEIVSPRSDIYSLSVVVYEILEGKHPFHEFSRVERLFKHINDPLPYIDTLSDRIRDDVNDVIQKASAKDPAMRYASVLEFATELRSSFALEQPTLPAEAYLTNREHEVLQCLVDGLSNREIAEKLFIAVGTVRDYNHKLFKKLGVKNRVQAAMVAIDMSLLGQKTGDNNALVHIPLSTASEPINPYKGLHAFNEGDQVDFFGRDDLIQKLLLRLQQKHDFFRFLSVVGPSGSGKSSLVKAGLIPAIRNKALPDSEDWFIIDMLPGSHPLDTLETSLIRIATNPHAQLREQLLRDNRGLIRVADIVLPSDNSELLIVIDQFEEVFTLVEDESERQQFLALLRTAVSEVRSRVRVIVTLRADYYDRPLHYAEFGELIRSRMETVLPLTAQGLERAVRGPTERVGVTFEQGLVEQIISAINYQSGALPLLQYALTELFDRREGRLLTHNAYQEIGGAVGALTNRAEKIYLEMGEYEQSLMRQLFLRLVTLGDGAEDTRRRTNLSELLSLTENSDLMEEIIDSFAGYRLLSLDHDVETRQPTVEVAHEAILREWDRLRQWLNESRADIRQERILSTAAHDWDEHNRDASYLLRGSRLEQFETWVQSSQLTLIPLERDFIQTSLVQRASDAEAERLRITREKEQEARAQASEKRSQNFLRGLVAVFALATFMSSGFGLFAIGQREAALESASEAQNVALVAGSQAALANNDTDTAIALALQAVTLNPDSFMAQVQLSEAVYHPGTIRLFNGHTEEISRIAISPDEHSLLSASWDDTLILWDAQTGEILRRLEGHTDDVYRVAFSPDGHTAVSGSWDKTAILWDLQTGQIIRRFEDYGSEILEIVFSPDGQSIIAGGEEGGSTLIQWDIDTGQVIQRFEAGHIRRVSGMAIHPDGSTILTSSPDGTLILWNVQTAEIIHHMGGEEFGAVQALAMSPDGMTALSADQSSYMFLWDLTTGELLRRYEIPQGGETIAYTPDGRHVLVGNNESIMNLWDIETGNLLKRFIGHTRSVFDIAVFADGRRAVSGSLDGTLRLWDLEGGQVVNQYAERGSSAWEIDRNPNGDLAISSLEDTAILWDLNTGEQIRHFEVDQPILTVAFSPNRNIALIGTGYRFAQKIEPGHIILWDVETGEEIRRFIGGHPFAVWDVEFSPDGLTALSGGAGGTLILWDIETGEEIRRFQGYENDNPYPLMNFRDVAFSPDGQRVLGSFGSGPIIQWDIETAQETHQFIGHTEGAVGIIYSPDGQMIFSGGWDNVGILWDALNGEIIHRLTDHSGPLFQPDFTPDGRFVLVGSGDGTSTLWEVKTGEAIRRFTNFGIFMPVFSADGGNALVGSRDGSLELWRIDETLDELVGWTQGNRYTPELTCEQRDLYIIEPLCEPES